MTVNVLHTHDQVYIALGRYVTAFSGLIFSLETSTIHLLTFGTNADYQLAAALVANQTAEPVASKSFSILFQKWKDLLTDDDERVLKTIRKAVLAAIEKRNRYMHDAWLMSSTQEGVRENEFSLHRIRLHSRGVEHSFSCISPEELSHDIAEIDSLSDIVNALAFYHNPNVSGPNISSRFRIDNGKPVLLRDIPK